MIIRTNLPRISCVPEVTSNQLYGYSYYYTNYYKDGIDGSTVGNYIKRKQTCQE